MFMQTKRFTKINDGFICSQCGKENSPLKGGCRDHCRFCLGSSHVDTFPGDRDNLCGGVMSVIGIDYKSKKGYILLYRCLKCGEIKRNKTANDDDFESLRSFFSSIPYKAPR